MMTMNKPRIADDFEYIAARMRELEDDRNELKYAGTCDRCDDHGWVKRAYSTGYRYVVCPGCNNRFDKEKPRD